MQTMVADKVDAVGFATSIVLMVASGVLETDLTVGPVERMWFRRALADTEAQKMAMEDFLRLWCNKGATWYQAFRPN